MSYFYIFSHISPSQNWPLLCLCATEYTWLHQIPLSVRKLCSCVKLMLYVYTYRELCANFTQEECEGRFYSENKQEKAKQFDVSTLFWEPL